jgi:hypothetical protein
MTTFAAQQDRHAELEARECAAWATYSEELRELASDAYDEAEPAAWDRLQETLREVEALRTASHPEG